MGETAAKLRLIFEALSQTRGIYLFDEFDSIGSARIPLARPRGDLAELLTVSYPATRLADMVLGERTRKKLDRVIREHRAIRILRTPSKQKAEMDDIAMAIEIRQVRRTF